MKKFSKQLFSTFLVVILVISILPVGVIKAFAATKAAQDAWFASALGRYMDPDGMYGYQCVDVADDYCIALFGNWQNTIGGCTYAKELFDGASSVYFTKIVDDHVTAGLIPQHGDIIVYGGTYGHVAVVDSADTGNVYVFQQNGDGQGATTPCKRGTLSYNNSIGWLRPKLDNSGGSIYPGSPTLTVAATNKSTEHVIFNWNATSNATSYDLRVSQAGTIIFTKFGIPGTSYSLLLPVGNYIAWVCSVNANSGNVWTGPANTPAFSVVQSDNLPQKSITYNGHIYSLYNENLTWKEAESVCETMGGHLATITSADEQQVISNLLSGGKRSFYLLGATDEVTEGTFKWVTNEPFSYSNWNTGQPDNYNGNEDYLMAYNIGTEVGKWNDANNEHNLIIEGKDFNDYGFICEVEPVSAPVATTIYNGSKYMLFDNNMTWKDAEAMCESLGGHLATVTSVGEQQTIEGLLASGKKSFYLLGGTDEGTEGTFKWITNEPFSYSKWNPSQPDNWQGLENYVELYNYGPFGWNDIDNSHNIIVDGNSETSYGFICEILTAPTFSATPSTPTNGNVTVTITYPAEAATKQYKIGAGTWTAYTTPLIITVNSSISARCIDGVGNISTSSSITINNIDKTAPVITVDSYTTTPTNQNIVVTASTNKGILNTTSHTFTANGSFDFVATDAVGNVTTRTVTISNIDKTAPVITVGAYTTTPTNQNVVVNVSTNEGTLNTTSHIFTANGNFDFVATDAAGNVTTRTVTISNIDKTPPATPIFSASTALPTNENVTVTITYPADAVTKEYKLSAGGWIAYTVPIILTDNDTVSARGADAVGNISTIGSIAVSNIDRVTPTTPTFTLFPTTPTSESVAVTINFPPDAAIKEYKIGAGNWTKYTGAVNVYANNTILARCADAAGNVSATGSIDINNIIVIVPVTKITLSATSLKWAVGQTGTLISTITPSTATNKTVTWKTSNTTIATIDNAGNVTAKGVGTATLTCTANDGSGIKATCKITVIPPTPTNLKAVKASTTSIKLTWSAVSGATGYYLYRYSSTTHTYIKIKTLTTNTYNNAGLTKGNTYYYKVQAYKTVSGITYTSALSSNAYVKL